MSAYYNLKAIILKRQDFKEDDLLVTVYSQEKGKLVLLARGAKKIKSKLAGHLEPVSLSYLNVANGRSIDQLIGADMRQSYGKIKNNLDKLSAAGWFLNLLDKMTMENHPDPRIFSLTQKYLTFLEKESKNYDIAKISAGFKLLHLLGLNPAGKAEIGFRDEIEFIIANNIDEICLNKKVITRLEKLEVVMRHETKTNQS
ncbi:DNA repair protein RecO [Candidatus Kuenenbacteria bacterium CG1_02_38_13]|uniref:DNA repair protein RecO n=1 Tax=Candidatus Kuenenbacteria bacterium CG1_02_38_13 TaxID=1805235 RepID=A0A1J4U651_9BACT|nr:MAG: DNA repair protein RecO [Candidatus Kuenenbacteria bacterium CG1_02_38_13]